MKPQARKCERCGKGGSCFSYRLVRNGQWTRGYFHLKCLRAELENEVSKGG